VLLRAFRVREAVVGRVLAGEKRHDAIARHVLAEVRDEMPEVVFLARPYGAVGEEDERAGARQPADRVIGVDPRVHALAGGELGPGRPQLRRDDALGRVQRFDEVHKVRYLVFVV
jgi:hypothetical protein